MRIFYPLLFALQFLTRLPVRLSHLPDNKIIGRSLMYYPLVGLLIGSCLSALHYGLLSIAAPNILRAAIEVTCWVLITGALHLDGLADMVDAWAGGRGNRQRTLDIMKDPTSGPMGVSALMLILLLKFSVLNNIFYSQWYILLLTPFVARCALVWLFVSMPYVRRGGLGEALSRHAPKRSAKVLAFICVAGALALFKIPAALLLASTLLVYAIFSYTLRSRIGGTTGDTAGALVEIVETVALVVATLALPIINRSLSL
ncbi:MAG: adenosylcobinamide-GDP ribazoletransferase [Pseudomonadota bacterium]